MSRAPVVTVDGPSGVGKGTIARRLARQRRWHFLDSGALYRILALAAARSGIDLQDEAAVAARAGNLDIRFGEDKGGREEIWLDGVDIAREVRAETTGNQASVIAVYPGVRAALLERQRDFRRSPGLVADGRDMGTVVFPDAELKIFLDASPEERARRRGRQLREAGQEARIADLLAEIRARDERDRSRSHAPLRPADDAMVIDTTHIGPDEVLAKVEAFIRARGLSKD